MAKKLNQYTEAHLCYLFDLYNGRLEKAVKEFANYNSPAAGYNVIMDSAYTLAMVSYALNMDKTVTIDYFGKSLDACKKLLQEPANRHVNPIVIVTGIHIATLLGKMDDAWALAGIREFEVRDFQEGSFFTDRIIMGYIHTLTLVVKDEQTRAIESAAFIIKENSSRKDNFISEYREYLAALSSICQKNQQQFDDAIQNILQLHKLKATEHSLREDTEALICIQALVLAALAIQNNLTVLANNEYLPTHLIQSPSPTKNKTI